MNNADRLNGQWIGKYTGTSNGATHVNIDQNESNYQGVAYLFDNNPQLPPAVAYFSTPNKERDFSSRTQMIQAIDRETHVAVPWKSVEAKYPEGTTFADYADVRGSCDQDTLTLSWVTNTRATGTCALPRSKSDQPSELVAEQLDWRAYKEHGIQLASKRPLFRGQNRPWRLRTPFHRSGRADLHQFAFKDVANLHRHLSPIAKHVFKLEDQNEYGAFLNLVQHHGYPTPILDWTYSPYVAAFFAYRGITNKEAASAPSQAKVRIFIFDSAEWSRSWQPATLLVHPQLHVTVREFTAIDNERMIPQQAASTVTSVDDIETHIRNRETDKKKYLQAIDLPMGERKQVIRELSYMGITAGALFPGLDGACEELAERNFEF
ncbi:MAG: FRG domain-containing protein [Candidatus Acidiferrales bacterium]